MGDRSQLERRAGRRTCRWRALVALLALVAAAACTRSEDETPTGGSEEESAEEGGGESEGGEGRLAEGNFGELDPVCKDGEASGAAEVGLTDEEIHIGVVTDKGAQVRAGLNKEMYDTSVAFAKWCNEQGGINGREIVVDDLDTKLTEFGQRITTACEEDFALVAGGAVFDNADNGERVNCGLPNFPAFVVTPEARVADLQVQPLPNPVYDLAVQQYRRMRELHPDATNYGVLWVDLAGVKTVHDQFSEAVEELGYDIVYDETYAPIGETGWRNFVQNMKEEEVQGFELIGEPENMTSLLNAMQTEGWYPDFITLQPNMFDNKLAEEAAASAGETTYIRSWSPTFDMADDFPGLADYIELMDTYNPEGKYPSVLGAQAASSWLLFAQAANECGNELTRQCVLDKASAVTEWTGGGMHAPSQPGNAEATVCGTMIRLTEEGFVYDEEATDPDDGVFNCNPDNVLELKNDYGVPRPED